MATPALRALWREVEELLKVILSREALPEASVTWVHEMLDHNELGQAWDALHDHEGGFSPESLAGMREAAVKMGLEPESEHDLHARALAETHDLAALPLWIELGARGNPDAPDRLRGYARCDDPELRDPAREALMDLGLSHEDPMP